MQDYWLHIAVSQSSRPRSTQHIHLARATAPIGNVQGGAMPTVCHPTWEQLATRLQKVGVLDTELLRAKKHLDNARKCTIAAVHLSNAQLRALGFTDIPADGPGKATAT